MAPSNSAHPTFKLKIVLGSTREGRAGEAIARWVTSRADEHPAFDVELLDLRDWPLPFFAETQQTIGDPTDPTYSSPIVREWNARMKTGEAFIFITPEYNHSISGVLKNAIDNIFVSWALRNKPAAMVGYSGGQVGGARAVEQLALILIEAEAIPLRSALLVGGAAGAFDEEGIPKNPAGDATATVMLDDLAWWADVLRAGREKGQLRPGNQRLRELFASGARR